MTKIEVTWDDEDKTIIRYTFLPGWTLKEFYEVYDSVSDLVRQSSRHVIGIIVDDSHAAKLPPYALEAFRRTVSKGKLPLAIVGGGSMAKILIRIAEEATSSQRQIFFTKTVEEARSALRSPADANSNE